MAFVERIESERLRDVYRYWQSKCGDRVFPRREDIDPTEIPALLPHVYLVDVIDGGRDFRFRLLGTHIVESVGLEFTGQLVSEFTRTHKGDRRGRDYYRLIEHREPQHASGSLVSCGREHLQYEKVICPLSSDGEKIDMIFGGLFLRLSGEPT